MTGTAYDGEVDSPAAMLASKLAEITGQLRSGPVHPVSRSYDLFGTVVEIEFLDRAIERLVHRPLAHLESAAGGAAATVQITCWDATQTPSAYPNVNVGRNGFGLRTEAPGLSNERYLTAFAAPGRILTQLDRTTMRGTYVLGDSGGMWRHEHALPMRSLLSWIGKDLGMQFLHAGSVGTPKGGILLIGRGGSGKSNTALSALASPLGLLSDDFCTVTFEPEPTAHAIYATGSTRRSDWSRNPVLRSLPVLHEPANEDGKLVYDLFQQHHNRLLRSFKIRAVAQIRLGGSTFRLNRIGGGAIVREVVPDTQMMLPYAEQEILTCVTRLVRTLPCYELTLGPDPAAIPGGLAEIVERLNAGETPD
jgi:hypothetical protein